MPPTPFLGIFPKTLYICGSLPIVLDHWAAGLHWGNCFGNIFSSHWVLSDSLYTTSMSLGQVLVVKVMRVNTMMKSSMVYMVTMPWSLPHPYIILPPWLTAHCTTIWPSHGKHSQCCVAVRMRRQSAATEQSVEGDNMHPCLVCSDYIGQDNNNRGISYHSIAGSQRTDILMCKYLQDELE